MRAGKLLCFLAISLLLWAEAPMAAGDPDERSSILTLAVGWIGIANLETPERSMDPPWSPETSPATGPMNESRPALAASHNRTHVVFYEETGGASHALAFARSSQGGTWSGANFSDPASDLRRPAVAFGDDLRGWAVAEDASNRSRLALLRSDDEARTWTRSWLDPSAGALKFSNICCTAIAAFTYQTWGDGIAIAFEGDQQGFANRTIGLILSTDSGATWVVQSYNGPPRYSPQLAVARGAVPVLILGAEEMGADLNTLLMRIDVPGMGGTGLSFDSGAGITDAQTDVAAEGSRVVWSFQSGTGVDHDIKVRISNDTGKTFGAPNPVAATLGDERSPCLSLAGRTSMVAWASAANWTASLSADGGVTWSAPARVASTANTLESPGRNSGCAASGAPTTVWSDNRNSAGGKIDVFFSKANDSVAPVVSLTRPAPGATSASTTEPVSVLFSEPMDAPSAQAGFRITPAVTGKHSWTGGGLLHFTPDAPLAPNTKYVVNLTGGKDLAGFSAAPFESNFTTEAGDTQPPAVLITTPANNSQVSGIVRVAADVTDDVQVDRVEFLVDGASKSVLTAPPWQYDWDATGAGVGAHVIRVTGEDTSGNAALQQINVNVLGVQDTQPPQVDLVAPADGSNITGTYRVRIKASDNVAVAYVRFKVGTAERANLTATPYEFDWDTLLDANGAQVVQAEAVDTSGNPKSVSANVWIQNGAGNPPTIIHSLPPDILAGADLKLTAIVRDDFGVAGAWVRFREIGRDDFAQMEMKATGENYQVSVPGRFVNPPGLEYYIFAEDDADQVSASPSDAPATLHKVVLSATADPLEFFEMRLGGVLPLWSILLLILVLVAISAAGAGARVPKHAKGQRGQVPWAGAASDQKKPEGTDPQGRPAAPDAGPPSVLLKDHPSTPARHPSSAAQSPGATDPAAIGGASSGIATSESEWGFPMGAGAGPKDTEPSLLAPGKRCPNCGAKNKFDARWCGQCRGTLGG